MSCLRDCVWKDVCTEMNRYSYIIQHIKLNKFEL